MVAEFMYAANQRVRTDDSIPITEEELRFCFHLMFEEVTELFAAKNIIAMADAIGDIMYTALWSANNLNLKPLNMFSSLTGVMKSVEDRMLANREEVNYCPLITRNAYTCLNFEQQISNRVASFIITTEQSLREIHLTTALRMCCSYALYLGLPMVRIFDEIHRANMTKFIDGYMNEEGKWKGGPSTEKPNLEQFILR